MSKYKVGDKVVMEFTDKISVMGEPWYVLSEATSISETYLDKAAEPLGTYTEPLEAKIRRQAAEITRLLAENKELKEDFEKSKIVNLNMGRCAGQNEAWNLARKIFDMETNDIEDIFITEDAWNLGTVLNNYTYQEAAAKVEAWEKAKPLRTIFDDFLEKYPNALVNDERVPYTCPYTLGYGEKIKDCTKKMNCFDCWNRPLEQIGEE